MTKFLLIAPQAEDGSDFAGIAAADGRSLARVAPVGIATVAALAPAGVECILHDEALEPVDFDAEVDFIGLSANVSQARRAIEIARKFRSRGKTVIVGGPHITLDPEFFTGQYDVAVTGEFEEIAPAFYADMQGGALKPRYDGGRPDLGLSPLPVWGAYDNDRALMGVAQTSRGCPFECNFCDVIQYLGRVQRHKTDAQVIAEVQQLYDLGYNRIMLADDNFTVYRRRATSLLQALAAWNGHDGRDFVTFATQVSVDVGQSPELLELCAEAGLLTLFIGIETVNEESLKEAQKRQNVGRDIIGRVERIVSNGLRVEAGLIVGFDADTTRIFEQQYEFAQRMPVGTFKISSLNAPVSTPLYADMLAAGRIVASPGKAFTAADVETNIVPAQMSREELSLGTRWLISRLFSPDAFFERFCRIAGVLGPNPLLARAKPYDPPGRADANRRFARMIRELARADAEVASVVGKCRAMMRERPELRDGLGDIMTTWLLALHNFRQRGVYDADWARLPAPPFDQVLSIPGCALSA
ncbi:radical SAM protein [Alteriqipengyuania sp.]|uniref:B12-binding domain-containing radical SAM protein n=1 Tax=Alteriqipengyuania sp. TaxID=2800692 RepID=UPI003514C4FA